MAMPNKTVVDATRVLNRFAPEAARAIGCWPFTEASGTSFANIGVTDDYGGFDVGASATRQGAGSFTFVDEATDPTNGPYVQTLAGTSSAGAGISLYANSSGSPHVFAQGSLLLRFRDPAGAAGTPASDRVIVNHGAAPSIAISGCNIVRTSADALVVRLATDTLTFAVTTEVNWDNWQTILIMWGAGRAPVAILNRNNATVTAAGGKKTGTTTNGNVSIANGRSLQLGCSVAGATAFTIQYGGAVLLDKRLDMYAYSDKRINRVMADPWLYFRPAPSIDTVLSTAVACHTSRVTGTSARISVVSGFGDAADLSGSLDGTVSVKIHYGTSNDPTSANFCNEVLELSTVLDSQIITQLAGDITGLDPDSEISYWAEWSLDDFTTSFPLPGGLHKFRTKRTIAAPWQVGFIWDPHLNTDTDIWDMTVLANIVYGPANYATGASRKALAYEKAIRYQVMYRDNDFTFLPGDFLMSDTAHYAKADYTIDERNNLLFRDVAVRAAHERNFAFELYLDGEVKIAHGNHETTNGYSEAGDRPFGQGTLVNIAAYRAISMNIIKMYWPGPTHETYPEFGGENEGDPSVDPDLSWVGNNANIDTYSGGRTQYLIDFVTGSTANPRGLHKSPLEIYYAFEWGGGDYRTLFIVKHSTFYTDPGDSASSSFDHCGCRFRPIGTFTEGSAQEAWCEAVHAASTAPNRFEISHQHTGGVNCGDATSVTASPNAQYSPAAIPSYGRNTGRTEPGAEHARANLRLRRNRANGRLTGHDHRACHSVGAGNLNDIKGPTPSAPSHSGGGSGVLGWHISQHEVDCGFGLAQSDGADLVTLGDGLGTALGNQKMLNVLGVMTLDIDGDSTGPLLRFVRTEIARGDDGASLNETPSYIERNLGELVTAVSDVVTLSERPDTIVEAHLAADIIRDGGTPFWSNPPTSKKGASVGDYPFEWDQPPVSTATLDSSVDDAAVYVMNTPAILYEARLGAASEDSGTSTLINACLATRGFSRGGR